MVVSGLGNAFGPHGIIARDDGSTIRRRKCRKRRFDARPVRITVNVGEKRLDARNQRLSVEQLADRDRLAKRGCVARTIGPGAKVGIEVCGCRNAAGKGT